MDFVFFFPTDVMVKPPSWRAPSSVSSALSVQFPLWMGLTGGGRGEGMSFFSFISSGSLSPSNYFFTFILPCKRHTTPFLLSASSTGKNAFPGLSFVLHCKPLFQCQKLPNPRPYQAFWNLLLQFYPPGLIMSVLDLCPLFLSSSQNITRTNPSPLYHRPQVTGWSKGSVKIYFNYVQKI